MTTHTAPAPLVRPVSRFAALRAAVRGPVLEPTDNGYAEALAGYGHEPERPLAVLVAAEVADLAAALRFAAAHGLPVGVRGTGHGQVRAAHGGLLLSTGRLTKIEVDPLARTARVEPGATWAMVQAAARPYGLAGLMGDTPSVGVVGFTLGGGTGWLARKHGLATDSLLELELLTPEGETRLVNASTEPELFRAVRGGGGGLGVVASMTVRLYPLETALCAQVIVPIPEAARAMRAYRAFLENVPDELTSRALFRRGPDIEAMPPFFRGRAALALQFCFSGPADEGRALLAPMLALEGSLARLVAELPATEFGPFFGAPPAPVAAFGRGEHANALEDGLIEAVVTLAGREPAPPFALELRHLGGAQALETNGPTSYAHRGAGFLLKCFALWPVPVLREPAEAMVRTFADIVRPYALGTVAPNFLDGDEGLERDRAAYPAGHFEQLAALKRELDPENRLPFARTPGSRAAEA